MLNQKFSRNFLSIEILFLLIVFIVSILIYIEIHETGILSMPRFDDARHIGISKNLKNGDGFTTNFIPFQERLSTSELLRKYPTIPEPLTEYGPLYYVLQSSYLTLFNDEQLTNPYPISIFNYLIILSLFFINYFFIRKFFGAKIAFLSTIFVITSFAMIFYSSRNLLYPLTYIFLISALFFIQKKSSNYIIFGLFLGLGSLTHPIGMMMGISSFVFLLIKKELRGFFLTVIPFLALVFPWMIRNYLEFGSIGKGLGIPTTLQFIGSGSSSISTKTDIKNLEISNSELPQTFIDSSSDFFESFFREWKHFIIQDPLLGIFSIIGIVCIILIVFRKQIVNKNVYENLQENKIRLAQLLLVFGIFNILNYILFFLRNETVVNELKYSLIFFILVIPFGIYLIKFGANRFLHKKFLKISLLSGMIIFCAIAIGLSIDHIDTLQAKYFKLISEGKQYTLGGKYSIIPTFDMEVALESSLEPFYLWAVKNIPSNSIVVTDDVGRTSIYTPFKSVSMPTNHAEHKAFHEFLQHYKISHIVLYGHHAAPEFEKTTSILDLNTMKIISKVPTDYSDKQYPFFLIPEFEYKSTKDIFSVYELKFSISKDSTTMILQIQPISAIINSIEKSPLISSLDNDPMYPFCDYVKEITTECTNSYDTDVIQKIADLEFSKIEPSLLNKEELSVETKSTLKNLEYLYFLSMKYNPSNLNSWSSLVEINRLLGDIEGEEILYNDLVTIQNEYLSSQDIVADLISISLQLKIKFYDPDDDTTKYQQAFSQLADFDRTNVSAILDAAQQYEERNMISMAIHYYEKSIPFLEDPTEVQNKIEELKLLKEQTTPFLPLSP